MKLYSQRDPDYDRLKIGKSNLTVHGYGCFVCSIATLYQKPVTELLKVQGAFEDDGDLFPSVLAKYCGGEAKPKTIDPQSGWCIAQTDHYKGFTHFFCINLGTKQMIDPLDFPAVVRPISDKNYHIVNFRPFTNIKLDTSLTIPTPVFPDVEIGRWSEADIAEAKRLGWVKGYPDGTFKPTQPMSREEVVSLVMKANRA